MTRMKPGTSGTTTAMNNMQKAETLKKQEDKEFERLIEELESQKE